MTKLEESVGRDFQLWMENKLFETEDNYMFEQGVKDKLNDNVKSAGELEDIDDIPYEETGYHIFMGKKVCYEEEFIIQSRVGLEMLYIAGLFSEQFKFMHEKLPIIPRNYSVTKCGEWAHKLYNDNDGVLKDEYKKEFLDEYKIYAPDILNKIMMFYRKTHMGDHDHAKIKFVLEELVEVNLNKVLADPENFELGYYIFANKKNPKGVLRNIMLHELSAMLVIVKEGYLDDYVYDIVNHKMINKTVISKLKKENSGGKEMNERTGNVEVSEEYKYGLDAGKHYLDNDEITIAYYAPDDYVEGQIKNICKRHYASNENLPAMSDNDSEFYLGFRSIVTEMDLDKVRRIYISKGAYNENKNKVYDMNGNPMFQNYKKDLLIDRIDHLIPGFNPVSVAFNLIMQFDDDGTSREVDLAVYKINQNMLADTSINDINSMRVLNRILLEANSAPGYEFSDVGEKDDLYIPHLASYEFEERKVVEIMDDIFIHYSMMDADDPNHVEEDIIRCARDNSIISNMLLLLSEMETSDKPFSDMLSLVANTERIIRSTKYKNKYLNIINSIIGNNIGSIAFTDAINTGNIKIVLVYNQDDNVFELAWVNDYNYGSASSATTIWEVGNKIYSRQTNNNMGGQNYNWGINTNNNWGNNNWGNNNGGNYGDNVPTNSWGGPVYPFE